MSSVNNIFGLFFIVIIIESLTVLHPFNTSTKNTPEVLINREGKIELSFHKYVAPKVVTSINKESPIHIAVSLVRETFRFIFSKDGELVVPIVCPFKELP